MGKSLENPLSAPRSSSRIQMDGFHGYDCVGRGKCQWLSSSKPALSRQVPFMHGDEFEELCWENGELVLVVPNRDVKPPLKATSTTALANSSDINTHIGNNTVSAAEQTITNDGPEANILADVNVLSEVISINHQTSLLEETNDQLSSPTQLNSETTPQKEFEYKGDDGDDMIAWYQDQLEHAPNTFVPEQAQFPRPGSISYFPSLSFEMRDAGSSYTGMQHRTDIRKDVVQHKWHRIHIPGRESSTITSLSESKVSSQMADFKDSPSVSLNDRTTETSNSGDSSIRSTITRSSSLGCKPTTENSVSSFYTVTSRRSPAMWNMKYKKRKDGIESSIDQKILHGDRVVPDLPCCSKSDKLVEESVLESGAASCKDEYSEFHGNNALENSKFSPFQGHFRKWSKVSELYNKSKKKWQDLLNMQLKPIEGVEPNGDKTEEFDLEEAVQCRNVIQSHIMVYAGDIG